MIVIVALALVVIVLAVVMLIEPRRSDYEQCEPDEGGLDEADVAAAERPQGNVHVLPPAEPDEDLREPGA